MAPKKDDKKAAAKPKAGSGGGKAKKKVCAYALFASRGALANAARSLMISACADGGTHACGSGASWALWTAHTACRCVQHVEMGFGNC